jgi:hypothetical protein
MEPRIAGQANLRFVALWLAVLGLIFVLLVLAFVDLMATRSYARRHRRGIARERLEFLVEQLRNRANHASEFDEPDDDNDVEDADDAPIH